MPSGFAARYWASMRWLEYALLPRTTLRAGVQGLGPLLYRRRDDTSERQSFEQHTSFLSVINTSAYLATNW